MPSRIVIGAMAHDPNRGTGLDRYTSLVVPELAARTDAIVYGARGIWPSQRDAIREIVPRRLAGTDPVGNLGRFLWMQTCLRRYLVKDGARLYYSPVQEGMINPPCPQIVTIHDLIPLRFPQDSPRMRHYFRHVLPAIVRGSAGVVVVSKATEVDLRESFDLGDRPVVVAPPGGSAPVFHPGEHTTAPHPVTSRFGRYLLAVGTARHKNMAGLLTAFSRMEDSGVALVIVGDPASLTPKLSAIPGSVRSRIHFPGPVSDHDLAAMYRGAAAFVFPSLYEGFGIPPLEAMACGTPVAASSVPAVRETCGNAAVYFDPTSPDDIARALDGVLADESLQRALRARGFLQARAFDPERSAKEIVHLMERVIAA